MHFRPYYPGPRPLPVNLNGQQPIHPGQQHPSLMRSASPGPQQLSGQPPMMPPMMGYAPMPLRPAGGYAPRPVMYGQHPNAPIHYGRPLPAAPYIASRASIDSQSQPPSPSATSPPSQPPAQANDQQQPQPGMPPVQPAGMAPVPYPPHQPQFHGPMPTHMYYPSIGRSGPAPYGMPPPSAHRASIDSMHSMQFVRPMQHLRPQHPVMIRRDSQDSFTSSTSSSVAGYAPYAHHALPHQQHMYSPKMGMAAPPRVSSPLLSQQQPPSMMPHAIHPNHPQHPQHAQFMHHQYYNQQQQQQQQQQQHRQSGTPSEASVTSLTAATRTSAISASEHGSAPTPPQQQPATQAPPSETSSAPDAAAASNSASATAAAHANAGSAGSGDGSGDGAGAEAESLRRSGSRDSSDSSISASVDNIIVTLERVAQQQRASHLQSQQPPPRQSFPHADQQAQAQAQTQVHTQQQSQSQQPQQPNPHQSLPLSMAPPLAVESPYAQMGAPAAAPAPAAADTAATTAPQPALQPALQPPLQFRPMMPRPPFPRPMGVAPVQPQMPMPQMPMQPQMPPSQPPSLQQMPQQMPPLAPPGTYWNPMPNPQAAALARNDSDNMSVRSDATAMPQSLIDDAVAAQGAESLESFRKRAKKSKDLEMYVELAKRLIQLADDLPTRLAGHPPKKIRKNQDLLNQEAVQWLQKAAAGLGIGKPGHPEALFLLADCYGSGALGLAIDHDRAFNLYAQSAKQNHPGATYRAAVSYEVGAGTKRDAPRAIQFYRKAAALGDTAAMFKLGMILLHGLLGQPQNAREGVTLLKRAASQADETTPHALHELASLYEGNVPNLTNVVIPDPAYAYELFLQSAKLGYAPSQTKLGLAHEYGHLGLAVEPRRSIAWYSKAAEQGDPEAELALSGWYLTGSTEGSAEVLRQSDQEAYLWARKAADKGLAKAEYAVGYFLENGVGIRADVDEARRWYMRAAAQSNKRAIQRLTELTMLAEGSSLPADQQGSKTGGGSGSGGPSSRDFRKTNNANNECSIM
ncbi:hypothetical protein BC831DRAFT_461519 [Entophlyctis helioformis]|nr:hypothetical protein BC831DRAFT_461519 [Entophlyctis helioformis]